MGPGEYGSGAGGGIPATGKWFVGEENIPYGTQRERRLKMNFRPLHDRILIKRIEAKEAAKGGIIIPDSAKEKPQEGEVIAVGNGRKTEEGKVVPLDVKAGDRILFGKYSGTEIKLDNQEYLIFKEEDVLGVVEGKAATASGKK
jgi:chaperonin GroES